MPAAALLRRHRRAPRHEVHRARPRRRAVAAGRAQSLPTGADDLGTATPLDLVDTMADVHAVDTDVVRRRARPSPTTGTTYLGGLIDRFRQADAGARRGRCRSCATSRRGSTPTARHRCRCAWCTATSRRRTSCSTPTAPTTSIDWELAHVGDPREDLGYYNVYSSALGPEPVRRRPRGVPRPLPRAHRVRRGRGQRRRRWRTSRRSPRSPCTPRCSAARRRWRAARNGGLMTTYTINALTVGHNNFMAACVAPRRGGG